MATLVIQATSYKTEQLTKVDVRFIENAGEVRYIFFLEFGLRIKLINFCFYLFLLTFSYRAV